MSVRELRTAIKTLLKGLELTEQDLVEYNHLIPQQDKLNYQSESLDLLSVYFSDNNYIQDLNYEFRGKNKPTDVLSFPSQPEFINDTLLGDIIISVDQAFLQAKEFGNTKKNELIRLLAHGILHLKGYEHEKVSKSIEKLMFLTQDRIIKYYQDSQKKLSKNRQKNRQKNY